MADSTGNTPSTAQQRIVVNNHNARRNPLRPHGMPGHVHRNRRTTLRERHGLFMSYLFLNLTLRYAAYFKSTARRLIEFFSLLLAILMFFVLFYIHVTFVRNSGDCLDHVKEHWLKNGILRVQVSNNHSHPAYQLLFAKDNLPSYVSFKRTPYNVQFKLTSPISNEDIGNYKLWKQLLLNEFKNSTYNIQGKCENENKLQMYYAFHLLHNKCPPIKPAYIKKLQKKAASTLADILFDVSVDYTSKEDLALLDEPMLAVASDIYDYSAFEASPVRDRYIIEYSKEFGYLRLSSDARYKLGIPILIVNLNPSAHKCFGNGLKNFVLKTFLGYDDFLMASIKKMAEDEKSQGYLKNVMTGEYFRFVTVWVNRASSVVAFTVMILFTLIVSMLLRYSYHQIFMFMMEVLRILDTDVRLVFPAAPLLTIVLALVGMEDLMTEFFHDSTIAFYVILLIWSADQFDVICLHTVIGRRHWVRFFFLYQFGFYIYNYKFNGQYSKLALFTSWLFIVHSMIYFFHHYEIPAIQREVAQLAQRSNAGSNATRPATGGNTDPRAEETRSSNAVQASSSAASTSNLSRDNSNEQSSDRTSAPVSENEMPDSSSFLCNWRAFSVMHLSYFCSFVLLILSALLASFIYSCLSWSNQKLDIAPMAL